MAKLFPEFTSTADLTQIHHSRTRQHTMSAQPSFSSLPSPVHREIAQYLAPPITSRCDLQSYLNLQSSCNPIFAREVRSVMKTPLQNLQAAIAAYDPAYVLKHPQIRHNPIYTRFLTFNDLCDIFGLALESRNRYTAAFAKIFVKFTQILPPNSGSPRQVRYFVQHDERLIRTEQLVDRKFDPTSNMYFLLYRGVEVSVTSTFGAVDMYDYALITHPSAHWPDKEVIFVGRIDDIRICFAHYENNGPHDCERKEAPA
ncbi:hypothetical protein HK097_008086 [Rhizophlyctis rosea]|uniref:Uncharacterized protein n=1 Tax=Rhizophlyctis rosea TaxID=64517 RepID=A0AAD5X456_9FUNG|nr:hypothetical protein HK097_008086 [Rhizophlyctis rosea]